MTPAGWVATCGAVAGLLAADWALGRRARSLTLGDAVAWSLAYVAVAVLFGVVLGVSDGWGHGTQYFAGYIVEKSLSVDNLFVFIIIIGAFAVPAAQQPKVLALGIAVALVLRAVFIAIGAALIDLFSAMFLVFGVALIGTAFQLFRHRNEAPRIEDNALVALARRRLPVSADYDGDRLLTHRGRRRELTPLFLALLAIGTTDLLFAFDSIPAVFGVTKNPYIVFSANAFSLLGMRPLFFLVSGLLDRLVYMSSGLAVILGFIGIKLVLEFAHHEHHAVPEISTGASLAVIAVVLVATTIASLVRSRRDPELRARPGSLRHREARGDSPPPE
jgi:tellurite resistance protein TerC